MGKPDDRRGGMDVWMRFVGSLVVFAVAITLIRALLPTLIVLGLLAVIAYIAYAVIQTRRHDRW